MGYDYSSSLVGFVCVTGCPLRLKDVFDREAVKHGISDWCENLVFHPHLLTDFMGLVAKKKLVLRSVMVCGGVVSYAVVFCSGRQWCYLGNT